MPSPRVSYRHILWCLVCEHTVGTWRIYHAFLPARHPDGLPKMQIVLLALLPLRLLQALLILAGDRKRVAVQIVPTSAYFVRGASEKTGATEGHQLPRHSSSSPTQIKE